MVQTLDAVLLVEVHEHFGVGGRPKAVPPLLELRPQLTKIVDLTIEGDPNRAVLVGEGRDAAGVQIDNGEAPLPEANPCRDVDSLRVRTAVNECAAHPF